MTFFLLFTLSSCNYFVETIYDGASLEELETISDYHFEANVEENAFTDYDNIMRDTGPINSFDYYKLSVKNVYKGEITESIVYIKYAKNVANSEDLVINTTYHFYCSLLSESQKPDSLKDMQYVFNVESPNAQCYTTEEYNDLITKTP